MNRKQIIILIVASTMVLFNVLGTITVVIVDVTQGKDIISDYLTSVIHIDPKPTETWFVEEWTLPIRNPQLETFSTEPIAENNIQETFAGNSQLSLK